MNRDTYSTEDVEGMLRELARRHAGRMDDAMCRRLLAVVHAESDRALQRRRYRAMLPWAAVLTVPAVAVGLLLPGGETEREVAKTASLPQCSYMREMKLEELENPAGGGICAVPNVVYIGRQGEECGVACPESFDIELYNVPL